MVRCLLVCCFLFLTVFVQAQEPYHYYVDEHEGVPSNDVYDILQDKKGYIWLATDKGLARYDGHKAKVFELPEARGIAITNLIEDNDGRIWFINFAGQIFYVENDEVKKFREFDKFYKSAYPFLTILNDDIWIADNCTDVLYQYSLKKKQWHFFKLPAELNGQKEIFIRIKVDLKKKIWLIAPGNSVYKFINGKFIKEPAFTSLTGIEKDNPQWRLLQLTTDQVAPNHNIQQMLKGIVYIHDDNQIRLHPLQKKYGIPDKLAHYHLDEGNKLFISTPNGLFVYTENSLKCFFKDVQTTRIIKDREGNYLVGTLGKGMIVIPSLENLLYNKENSFLKTDKINKLHFFDERLAISDNIGYTTLLDFPHHQVSQYRNKENDDPAFGSYYNKKHKLLLFGNVLDAFSRNGKIVFNKKLFTSRKDFCNVGTDYVATAGTTGVSMIYIPGLLNGKSRKSTKNTPEGLLFESLKRVEQNYGYFKPVDWQTQALNVLRCKAVAYMPDTNTLYVAEANGLWYFSTSGNGKVLTSDGNDVITHKLVYDSLGKRVLAAVFMKGIYEIKGNTAVPFIDATNGLTDKYINSFAVENSKLVLTHRAGIQLFDIRSKAKVIADYTAFLFCKDVKDVWLGYNRIFLGTTQGLQILPLSVTSTRYQPPVYIEQLQVNNKRLDLKGNVSNTFSYHENNFEFALSGISYSSKNQNAFLYRLVGLHTNWRKLSNSNVIRYNLLPPGRYTFEVLAVMPDGTQSAQKAVYMFEINPPFYQTWWFYMLCLLLFTSVTVLLVYWFLQRKHQKISQIQEKQRLTLEKMHAEQEMELSKLTALKAQLNPHFLFNVLNSIQNTIYTGDKKEAFENLGKFSNMTRKILEYSNTSFISLDKELEVLKLYLELEKLRYKEKLQFKITLDEDVPQNTPIPSMLLQPFIENAIKHGIHHLSENGLVEIHVLNLSETHFKIEITDNGIGRTQSAVINKQNENKPESFATKAIEERILFYNKSSKNKISLQYTDLEQGTLVLLEIPYYD